MMKLESSPLTEVHRPRTPGRIETRDMAAALTFFGSLLLDIRASFTFTTVELS